MRDTRAFDERSIVIVYNPETAFGQKLLYTYKDGKYKNHVYKFSSNLQENCVVLISNQKIFYFAN